MSAELGYGPGGVPTSENAPFVAFKPPIDTQPSGVCIYSPFTKATFRFSGPPTPPLPLHFARKFTKLAHEQGAALVLLSLPILADMRDPTIREREFWPDVLHADVIMMGIPPARLFARLTDDEVRMLYYNPDHLNKNGQEYFTSIITPRLLEIYAAQTHR
jgi:hypothetical protein